MNYFKLSLFFIFSSEVLSAQNNKLPKVYKFSDEIAKMKMGEEHAAFEYSAIGEYQKTLDIWDKVESKTKDLTKEQILNLRKFRPVDAYIYLKMRAKIEKIIIINEAHHQPYHRLFTTNLLQSFYDHGFRYLALEALGDFDTLLGKRGYPIINSGGYTQEPMFGNMLREALRIGYKLVAYEESQNSGFDNLGNNLREVEQAKNIKKILDADSNAKMIIHCGFGHLKEGKLQSWGKAMAGRLIEYTGINPLTVEQTRMSEHSKREYEDPLFKFLKMNYSAVLVDSSGETFHESGPERQFDLRVFHPRTNNIHGRPNWLFDNGRKPYYLGKLDVSFPYHAYAYLDSEKLHEYNPFENPVPYDIIEVEDDQTKKALSLKPGKYLIVIADKSGKEQKISVAVE